MNAFALHEISDQAAVRRWGASAFAITAAHAALIALALNWYTQRPVPGVSLPAIMVDMAPVSAAPQPTQMDLAPGPVMQQADASPPEPAVAEAVQEQIAPTPPQEKPEVVAPPEQKVEMKPVTEPAKPVLAHRRRPLPPTGRWSQLICNASSNTHLPPRPQASRAPHGSASRSAEAAACFPSASAARQVIRRWMPRRWRWCAAPSRFPHSLLMSSRPRCRSARRWRSIFADPIPSPRPSATTRSNPRTANKTARPAASRAASPPSARPTGRRRR